MGSFAPPELWNQALADQVTRTIMEPVIQAMATRKIPYRGVLYAGLMLTPEGPKVLEFNCRLGDPESQVVLPLLSSDPLEVMTTCLQGRLSQVPVHWDDRVHVGVVMVSGGYPGSYETGFDITGLDPDEEDTIVFHAGTRRMVETGRDRVVTSGGRVLTVVGKGDTLAEARARAYHRVEEISFPGVYYRTDIAAVEGTLSARVRNTAAPAG